MAQAQAQLHLDCWHLQHDCRAGLQSQASKKWILGKDVMTMLQAAEASSASERDQRMVAEALAQQLQAEGARRANVFNAAVRSAVSRIQSQLEAERDELGSRCQLTTSI